MENFIYMEIMKSIPGKAKLIEEGIKQNRIRQFDPELIIKMRHIYYAGIPGSIYLYMKPAVSFNIGDKAMIMVTAFEDQDFDMVHGVTLGIKKNNRGPQESRLHNTTWLELREGGRTWIYDLFSLLKIERDLFYELEEPEIIRTLNRSSIIEAPEYKEDLVERTTLGDPFYLMMYIPNIEIALEDSPYRQYLRTELIRFKREIDYERICKEMNEEKRSHMW